MRHKEALGSLGLTQDLIIRIVKESNHLSL